MDSNINANSQIDKPIISNRTKVSEVFEAIINTGNARKDAFAKP